MYLKALLFHPLREGETVGQETGWNRKLFVTWKNSLLKRVILLLTSLCLEAFYYNSVSLYHLHICNLSSGHRWPLQLTLTENKHLSVEDQVQLLAWASEKVQFLLQHQPEKQRQFFPMLLAACPLVTWPCLQYDYRPLIWPRTQCDYRSSSADSRQLWCACECTGGEEVGGRSVLTSTTSASIFLGP